ncbi:MAG: MG2 domain-containing protein [Candidatus Gracilibacteria bacterium]
MQFNLFLEKVKLYKKQILSFFIAFVVAIVGVFYYTFFINPTLQVLASNFDFSYRKIPFDIGYIDFTLSSDLDKSTVTKENFLINPKIDGEVSLVGTNTIRYKFLQKLNIGDDISITLKQNIKSKKGKNLDQEYNYIVSVIEGAKVLKISPEGELDNLGQNIAVFFNIPMIALTNLDAKDKLPCPIEIEPKLEGTCKWTTSSVLEYIPKDGFLGATKYKVTVAKSDGLLYKLGTGASVEINTPKLEYLVDKEFSVNDNIKIRFNFAPDLDSLKDKLKLYEKDKSIDFNLAYELSNNSVVIVSKKSGKYKFDESYKLDFKSGIKPKYGNIETEIEKSIQTQSLPFLNDSQVYQNIFSGSELINTEVYPYYSDIPSKNVFLELSFEEEINVLDKNLFSFEDKKGNKIDFDLSYKFVENESCQIINGAKTNCSKNDEESYLSKKIVKFILRQNLQKSGNYKLIIKKDINLNLDNDITKEFKTAPEFVVTDYKFISYSKSCLYLNNFVRTYYDRSQDFIQTIPSSKVSSISNAEYIDYQDRQAFGITPYNEDELKNISDDILLSKGYCPKPKDGSNLYIINTRLNPNTSYKIQIKNTLEDMYANTIYKPFEIDVKTGEIAEKDKYLYISLSKETNLIPINLPLVVNLQTINLDNINVEVCEMDKNGYIDYVSNRWTQGFSPKCSKNYYKNLKVKNNYWNLTNNKFDIEQDIIGGKTTSNFVLVKGDAGGRNQFSNLFIRSDLNVTFESGSNKKLLFVTDFSGNEVQNLKLEFYNATTEYIGYAANPKYTLKSVIPKYTLNKEKGVYEIEGDLNYNYIFVSNDKYFGIVDLNNNMFSDYDFKYVGGNPTSDTNYLYLYTERPIYKPGDTVYIKGLLRKFEYNGYKKSTIKEGKLEVLDSNYQVISTMDVKLDNNSNFNTKFVIPAENPLGKFSFRFGTGKEEYYKNDAYFNIEEYKKPDFKIDVAGLNKDYSLGDKVSLQVLPQYYFGGNLVSTKGQYSVLTQNYFFDAKDYSNYQFGEGYAYFDCVYWGYCSYEDNLSDVKNFKVDENGKGIFNYNFPTKTEESEKIYNFNIEVEDKDTKKTVNKTVSTILHSTDAYVGIEAPYWNDKKQGIKGEFVVLDYDAKPLISKDIKIEIIKTEWKQVKKQGVDGVFYDDYTLEETKQDEFNLKTNINGIASKTFITKDSGEYKIKAIYTGSNGKNFVSTSSVYVASDDYVSWYNPNNDTTEITPEKTQVLVGEKAYYTLKSPVNNGKALIIIEKDDGILDYFVQDIKSYGDRITIDVKNSYYPNYYVRAFLIGRESGNPLPIYKRALASTKVSTEYKRLNVTISTNKKSYKPGEKVGSTITVLDAKGNPVVGANGSISIVDESLLALVGNPKKNPYAFFYEMKRYLGTLMYSSMINLIEKLEVKDVSNGEKGGAGEQIKGGDSKKKRGVFKDTAFWQADFTTDKNGKAIIQSEILPDNLTTWVLEVIVNTPVDNKIGIAYDTVTTTKELIINDNLPNFFGVGDEITLSPVVFNKTGKDGNFEIAMEGTNIEIKGGNKKNLFIKNGESKTVNFLIKVNERSFFRYMNVASSKIDFKASEICEKNCANSKVDEIEKVVQIKDSATKESVATNGKTKDNSFDEHIDLSTLKDRIGQVRINYSATLFNNIIDSIDYLNQYPYGCSEQKTSAIMPNIYVKKLYTSVGKEFDFKSKMIDYYDSEDKVYKKKSLDQVTKDYMVDIRKYQKSDGGFVYWYDVNNNYPNYSNFHLTSYILSSLSEVEKMGYNQEQKVILDTVAYLKDRFYKNQIEGCIKTKYNDCKYSDLDRLNAIEAIQSYDSTDYETYKMYKLLTLKNVDNSTILKKAFVVANLLKIKNIAVEEKNLLKQEVLKDINNIINNELVYNPRGAYIGRTEEYSRIENTSLLLKVISVLGNKDIKNTEYIVDNLNRWIISQKKDGSFGSTQDNISVIDAVYNYIIASEELKNINFNLKIKLNSDIVEESTFNDSNKLDVNKKFIDLKYLKDNNILNFEKTGVGTVYYDLSMDYFLTGKDVEARDEGFAVIKEYYDYNQFKKIDSLKKEEWKQYEALKISYDQLKYKKSVYEYLTKVSIFKVGQLVVVRNRLITPETRDKVAFEGFIPAGSELVNPNLATSSKAVFNLGENIFEKTEYRQDRLFGYITTLNSGIYDFAYLVRFTHAGTYYVKPSYISEFYNAEVFGRSSGEVIVVR